MLNYTKNIIESWSWRCQDLPVKGEIALIASLRDSRETSTRAVRLMRNGAKLWDVSVRRPMDSRAHLHGGREYARGWARKPVTQPAVGLLGTQVNPARGAGVQAATSPSPVSLGHKQMVKVGDNTISFALHSAFARGSRRGSGQQP